jgi:hypothetical protein
VTLEGTMPQGDSINQGRLLFAKTPECHGSHPCDLLQASAKTVDLILRRHFGEEHDHPDAARERPFPVDSLGPFL